MGTHVILPSDKDQLEDRPYNEFYAALKAWGGISWSILQATPISSSKSVSSCPLVRSRN
jgi:hypothetical protein